MIFEKDLHEPEDGSLKSKVISELREVYDPDISINVYDLGLIYHININEEEKTVDLVMTLTSPFCPVADQMPIWVEEAVANATGNGWTINIKMTFDPPFTPEMMPEDVRFAILGY